jgi:hypothetical protein
MSEKSNIKVIKKADAVAKTKPVKKAPTPREAAREMVSTVTDWVVEVKNRKSEETRAALDLLFNAGKPSES